MVTPHTSLFFFLTRKFSTLKKKAAESQIKETGLYFWCGLFAQVLNFQLFQVLNVQFHKRPEVFLQKGQLFYDIPFSSSLFVFLNCTNSQYNLKRKKLGNQTKLKVFLEVAMSHKNHTIISKKQLDIQVSSNKWTSLYNHSFQLWHHGGLSTTELQHTKQTAKKHIVIWQQLFNSCTLRGRPRLVHSPSCCQKSSSSFQGLGLSIANKIKLWLFENMLLSNHSGNLRFYRNAEPALVWKKIQQGLLLLLLHTVTILNQAVKAETVLLMRSTGKIVIHFTSFCYSV